MLSLGDHTITALFAYSVEGTGLMGDQMAKWLMANPDKQVNYMVPHAMDTDDIRFRDTLEQIEWVTNYISGGTRDINFLVKLSTDEVVEFDYNDVNLAL